MLKWLWLSVSVIALDQITKALASAQLVLHEPVAVLPTFNLTLMHNSGAAFSFLSQAGGWQRWFFVAVAVGVSLALGWWLQQLQRGQRWLAISLALVLGGALGNVWDRIVLGYVVDFVDLYYGDWHWPAFNVADSAITVGAIMLLLDAVRGERRS
ncbi:MAG: signal peptidase II [Gammaproteobacteria bacterium HGW-Gammaproteobacteria-1]|jgi:signal peptidase II|nr:MAG: signal peptidase II [Gammaproteobacteria bacterium HGW-Gammaproteobacteria-1]